MMSPAWSSSSETTSSISINPDLTSAMRQSIVYLSSVSRPPTPSDDTSHSKASSTVMPSRAEARSLASSDCEQSFKS